MSGSGLSHISKGFKSGKVLEDVSLDVNAGEIVAIVGPSGTGKTVLLRIIAGSAGAGRRHSHASTAST
jgi:ABC-type sugar transport system ATPase subunit